MKDLAAAYGMKKMNKGPMKCAHGGPAMCNMGCYAEGGMVNEKLNPHMEAKEMGMHPMVQSILKKRMMAEGGMVQDNHSASEDYMSADDDESMAVKDLENRSYPDEDDKEQREEEQDDRHMLISHVLDGIRRKQMLGRR